LVDSHAPYSEPGELATVSCPSTSLCVAFDANGNVLTSTDPAGGASTWSAPIHVGASNVNGQGGEGFGAISCPTVSLCVRVDWSGNVVASTNPTGGPSAWTAPANIDPGVGDLMVGVTCSPGGLCVAFDEQGNAIVSTNPTGGASAWSAPVQVLPEGLQAMSCPSSTLCVGTGGYGAGNPGDVVTSTNPTGGASAWASATVDGSNEISGISCPSVSLCVAIDNAGNVVTSTNPTGGAAAWTAAGLGVGASLQRISCPSTSLCVAYDNGPRVFTSTNPAAGASAWSGPVLGDFPSAFPDDLSCASAALCVAADEGGNVVTTTTPTAGAWTTTLVDGINPLKGISCPSASLCVGVDGAGNIATSTNPTSPASTWSDASSVDPPGTLGYDGDNGLTGVSCPATTLCVAVDANGNVVTSSNPAGGASTWHVANIASDSLPGVSCASATLCVAVDSGGSIYSSTNPAGGASAWQKQANVDSNGLSSVSCPTASLCVALSPLGDIATATNPTGGASSWTIAKTGDGGFYVLGGLSCASASLCAAVDILGNVVTSTNPTGGASTWQTTKLETNSGQSLFGVSCPATTFCVIPDGTGNVLTATNPTGGPSAWNTTNIEDGISTGLTGVSCPSASLCVATDSVGDAIVGQPATTTPPGNTRLPTISGTASQGQMLTETNGSWSNSPTSFGYQWEDCDSSGNACSAITGATAQTYTLAAADVGSTIRVVEAASNAAGAGSPASSVHTAVVLPLPPSSTGGPGISGTVTQGQTLTETHGAWSNSPTSFGYQWEDCDSSGNACSAITGATAQSYVLAAGDVGHTLRVQETASNAGGSSSPATSSQSGVIQALPVGPAPATAPVDQSAPTITGTATVGSVLSASTGTWSGTTPISYAYQWQRCNPGCATIAGATGASYTLAAADLGAQVRVLVTASNSTGSAAAASASSATVTAITPAAPTPAQIKTLLLKEITPTGKAATIAALLKAGGDTTPCKALSAGTAVVDWYYVPAGAHIAKAKPKAQLLASGRLTFTSAGTGKLKIRLTAAGKNLLKGEKSGHGKLLKLTSKATFTPVGHAAIVIDKTFTPKR
jgi:hypothetical protein